MSSELTGWSRRRWVFTVLSFFIAHFAALQFLKSRPAPAPNFAPPRMDVQMLRETEAEALLRHHLSSDPTLFVRADARSFSGAGWLASAPHNYDLPDWVEPSALLPYTPAPPALRAAEESRLILSQLNAPPPEPVFQPLMPGEQLRSRSSMELQGAITNLSLLSIPELPSFPTTILSSNTVVEISADQDGQVILSRIITRSAIPAADDLGSLTARRLIFDPPGKKSLSNGGLWSGWVIFHWKAYFPTNTSVEPAP